MSVKSKQRLRVLNTVQRVSEVQQWTSQKLDKIRRTYATNAKDTLPIPCKRGCNACCRMQTIINAGEALVIARKNRAFVRSRLPILTEHAKITEQICRTHKTDIEQADAWFALQIPCALLAENGDCGVYEDRPIICRTHMVIDDPAKCAVVPVVKILHLDPTNLKNEALGRTAAAWIDEMQTETYPIGSLPKMVLTMHTILEQL